MKLQEALDLLQDPEKLRIRAAELDGWELPAYGSLDGLPPDSVKDNYPSYKSKSSYYFRSTGATKATFPISNYPTDANALHEAEKRLGLHDRSNTALRGKWANCLHDLMGKQPGCSVNKSGSPVVSDIDCLLAPTPVRCVAFVMVAEWKKVNQPDKL